MIIKGFYSKVKQFNSIFSCWQMWTASLLDPDCRHYCVSIYFLSAGIDCTLVYSVLFVYMRCFCIWLLIGGYRLWAASVCFSGSPLVCSLITEMYFVIVLLCTAGLTDNISRRDHISLTYLYQCTTQNTPTANIAYLC